MKTVALRFAENFAPECGTIAAHEQMIDEFGFVWYGKLGSPVSSVVTQSILDNSCRRILLIHSGGTERYWAYVEDVSREVPDKRMIPAYYRANARKFGFWFKVTHFESARKDVMSHCTVSSSKKSLSFVSRQSMSPYFIIEYDEEGE